MLIGLAGWARVGKDEVARFLIEDHGYTRVAFADGLRACLLALDPMIPIPSLLRPRRLSELVGIDGWELAKDQYPEVRVLLQRLGTEVVRDQIDPDAWVTLAGRKVQAALPRVVLTDCRFPNEVELIYRLRGQLWRITRPGCDHVNAHISEGALDRVTADQIIDNDGSLVDLRQAVDDLVKEITP